MSRLGIELLSVFGMPPVEHVRLAAELGCGHISTGLTRLPFNPHGYPEWSLRDDPGLRRDMKAAMRECGVVVGLGEGFAVRPGQDMRDKQRDLDVMAELGAERVSGVSMDPDLARTKDEFALLAEYAAQRGIKASIEFAPPQAIATLPQALSIVEHVGRGKLRLLLDSMHFYRSGATTAELVALDPDLIGYAQLCDVPKQGTQEYLQEAMFNRKVPGAGELPLAEFVAALPCGTPIGLEIPMLAAAEAGVSAKDRLRPAVAAAKALVEASK